MPIRYTATVTTEPLDQLEAFFDQFEDVAYQEFEATVDEIRPLILDELRTYPGAVKYPIEWASDKQRRFVMAKLRKENNLPYQRTEGLKETWQVALERSSNGFFMRIENTSDIAKYVVGSLAKDRQAALRFQQPFHKNTGWQAATDTTQFWVDALVERYTERMENIGTVAFKGRAYTR